jgi:hypothetical protein
VPKVDKTRRGANGRGAAVRRKYNAELGKLASRRERKMITSWEGSENGEFSKMGELADVAVRVLDRTLLS